MAGLVEVEGIGSGGLGITTTRIELSMVPTNKENDVKAWGMHVDPETGISVDPEVQCTKMHMCCNTCKCDLLQITWRSEGYVYPTIYGLTPVLPELFSKDARGRVAWIVVKCPLCGCYKSALINHDEFLVLRITGALP